MKIRKNLGMLTGFDRLKELFETATLAEAFSNLKYFTEMLDQNLIQVEYDSDEEKDYIQDSNPKIIVDDSTYKIIGIGINNQNKYQDKYNSTWDEKYGCFVIIPEITFEENAVKIEEKEALDQEVAFTSANAAVAEMPTEALDEILPELTEAK